MNTGESFSGNLLGGLTLGDGLHNLHFCGRQYAGALLLFLLLDDDCLQSPLTDMAAVTADGVEGIADVLPH